MADKFTKHLDCSTVSFIIKAARKAHFGITWHLKKHFVNTMMIQNITRKDFMAQYNFQGAGDLHNTEFHIKSTNFKYSYWYSSIKIYKEETSQKLKHFILQM